MSILMKGTCEKQQLEHKNIFFQKSCDVFCLLSLGKKQWKLENMVAATQGRNVLTDEETATFLELSHEININSFCRGVMTYV